MMNRAVRGIALSSLFAAFALSGVGQQAAAQETGLEGVLTDILEPDETVTSETPLPSPTLRPEPEKSYDQLQAEVVLQDQLIALALRDRPTAPSREEPAEESAEVDATEETDLPVPNDRPTTPPVHVILSGAEGPEKLVTVNTDGSRSTSAARPLKQPIPTVDPTCPSRLRALGVAFSSIPNFRKESGCQNVEVLSVTNFGSGVSLNPNVHVTCEVAEGMALWMRNSVQAETIRYFGQRIVKLSNTHGYSCRLRSGGKVSEHGFANAIDIGTFHLSDGKTVSVLDHWRTDGTAFGENAARWFSRVNDSACDYFQLVLNPRSNKAHENHFHLDQGPWKSCD